MCFTLIFPLHPPFCSSTSLQFLNSTPFHQLQELYTYLHLGEIFGHVGEQGWVVAANLHFVQISVFSGYIIMVFAVLQFFANIIIANYQISWTEDPGRLLSHGVTRVKT